jgi:hypothetical protein
LPAEVSGELEHVMTMRTIKRTVTFARPFKLGVSDTELPAGRYLIETDEELVDGASFPVYRRTATIMQLIADPLRPGITETMTIDPLQLEAALEADSTLVRQAEPKTLPSVPGAERTVETKNKTEEP